jgi:hypothetical protein
LSFFLLLRRMWGYKENTKRSSHFYIHLIQLITLIDREFQNRARGRIFGPTIGWRKLQNRGFIFCNCHKILRITFDNKVQKDEMGGPCNRFGKDKKWIQILFGKLENKIIKICYQINASHKSTDILSFCKSDVIQISGLRRSFNYIMIFTWQSQMKMLL